MVAFIVEIIVDGVLKAMPKVLHKLFRTGFYELFNFNDYSGGYGGYNNNQVYYDSTTDLKRVFGNLGIFGFLPMIFLKIIDALTTFMNVLRKNKLFKNFILPALILVIITGSVVFLIWWLQIDSYSDTSYNKISYNQNYNYPQYPPKPNNYYNPNYHYAMPNELIKYDGFKDMYKPSGYSTSYFNN